MRYSKESATYPLQYARWFERVCHPNGHIFSYHFTHYNYLPGLLLFNKGKNKGRYTNKVQSMRERQTWKEVWKLARGFQGLIKPPDGSNSAEWIMMSCFSAPQPGFLMQGDKLLLREYPTGNGQNDTYSHSPPHPIVTTTSLTDTPPEPITHACFYSN